MYEDFPYTNLHQLNLDWLVDVIEKLHGNMVISVNGQTGEVILYQNATMQLPNVDDRTWTIIRNTHGVKRGIKFDSDGTAYIVSGNSLASVFTPENPPACSQITYDQYIRLTTLTDEQMHNWNIFRTLNNQSTGIEFDDTGEAYIIYGSNRYRLYSTKNPISVDVTSVNGQTGDVVLYTDSNGEMTLPGVTNPNVDAWSIGRTINGTACRIYIYDDGQVTITAGNDEYRLVNSEDLADLAEEVEDLKNAFFTEKEIPYTLSDGYINTADGAVYSSINYYYTPFIDVSAYSEIKYYRPTATTSDGTVGMVFYGANQPSVISSETLLYGYGSQTSVLSTVRVPANAKYARFTQYRDTSITGLTLIGVTPVIQPTENNTTALNTTSNLVDVIQNDYGNRVTYMVRTGETNPGITRADGSIIFPMANQGSIIPANAPKAFLNNIINSYVGNENLIYGNSHTLFSDSCTNEIDCSSFVYAVLYGISYNCSKYVANNNTIRYYNGENMNYSSGAYTRRLSYQMAEYYANCKRLFALPNDIKLAINMLEYGDILFVKNENGTDGNYYGIGHCVFVLGTIPNSNYVVVAQAGTGPSGVIVRHFNNTVVKISVLELTSNNLETYFRVFARPNYAQYQTYTTKNITGNDLLLNAFWSSGNPSGSSTWSATPALYPVTPGTTATVISKSTRNPRITISEYTQELVWIKNTSVTTTLQLGDSTRYISINYGFFNSDNKTPTFADLMAFELSIS